MEQTLHNLHIRVHNSCQAFPDTPLYLHGDFNQWHNTGHYLGTAPLPGQSKTFLIEGLSSGIQDFKLSRGSMQTVLASASGHQAGPVQAHIGKETQIEFHINSWRDQYQPSTALAQVELLAESFHFPSWNTSKRVWVYLPEQYHTSKDHFSVMYMHDGQYLFDESTAEGKAGQVEWGVDETIASSSFPSIVVGIESARGKQRMQEYLLSPFQAITRAQGKAYLHDVVHTLKPYIDARYRTRPQPAYTAMAGSSLGGLLSLYAGMHYSEIFGTIGAFSPSLWMDGGMVLDMARKPALPAYQQYYIYAGGEERRKSEKYNSEMLLNAHKMAETLQENQAVSVLFDSRERGRHGAWYWQQAFPRFYALWTQRHLSDDS